MTINPSKRDMKLYGAFKNYVSLNSYPNLHMGYIYIIKLEMNDLIVKVDTRMIVCSKN